MRLPGVAPGPSTWQEDILLLNHSREIKRAGRVLTLPARAISTKNKHLLVIYSIPTRGFTAAVSVFRGTPPPKPLNCKIRFAVSGDRLFRAWTHRVGEDSLLFLVKFSLSPEDITWMSRLFCSQIVRLSLLPFPFSIHRENKKPCLHFVSRVRENLFRSSEPAYAMAIPIRFGLLPDRCGG